MKHVETTTEVQAEELVKFIEPAIKFPGRRAFVVAVWKTAEIFKTRVPDDIDFTKDVYPAAAAEIHKSVGATERAIYRGAAYCWRKGRNEHLHKIIGTALPVKPKPSDMLRYCAYYMIYNIPYQHASKEPSLPLPF